MSEDKFIWMGIYEVQQNVVNGLCVGVGSGGRWNGNNKNVFTRISLMSTLKIGIYYTHLEHLFLVTVEKYLTWCWSIYINIYI